MLTKLSLLLSLFSHSVAPSSLCSLSHTHPRTVSRTSFLHTAADMAEVFVGTWNLKESEKFDEYMKELGKCAFLSVQYSSMCM